MRRFSAFWAILFTLAALATAPAAERETEVFLIRFSGADGDVRFKYQDLPAAAHYLSPVAFSVRGGRLEMRADSSSGILERERTVLARRPAGSLERVTVLLAASPGKEPRPGRTVSLSFTLDELLARGGAWSAVPAAWACYTAAQRSGWTAGRVWARSVVYNAKTGSFTVKVGLSR